MAVDQVDRLEPVLTGILRLLAVQTVEGKNKTAAVSLLDRAGLDSKAIAEVCEIPRNSVRALLSQARKTRKTKRTEGEPE